VWPVSKKLRSSLRADRLLATALASRETFAICRHLVLLLLQAELLLQLLQLHLLLHAALSLRLELLQLLRRQHVRKFCRRRQQA